MSKRDNENFKCIICFESLDLKKIDNSTELDFRHIFHEICLENWCNTCIKQDNKPNCPLCRKVIKVENLNIPKKKLYQNVDNQIFSVHFEIILYILYFLWLLSIFYQYKEWLYISYLKHLYFLLFFFLKFFLFFVLSF